jgi:MFS superfamily sulfate permease-like transporter
LIYRFGAPIFFFNAAHFASRVRDLILSARPQVTFFLINAEAIVEMDVNAAEMLEELYDDLKSRGIVLGISNAKGHFRKVLLNTGLPKREGFNLYPNLAAVLQELAKKELEEQAREVAAAKEALTEAEKVVNQSVEQAVIEAVRQVEEAEVAVEEQEDGESEEEKEKEKEGEEKAKEKEGGGK